MSFKNHPYKGPIIWLISGCVLILVMIIIGGLTRLTHSGLSMVDWNIFMGSIPPLSEIEWLATFDKYKNYPEYQKVNFNFSLDDFKSIFWWEYLHRLLGRILGIVFIIPFVYFLIKKKFNQQKIKQLIFLLLLGAFQGFLGWYMVKSGLVKDPSVSHYRLAAHLMTALATICFSVWIALDLYGNSNVDNKGKIPFWVGNCYFILTIILIAQLVYGAFVAGLKAGMVYNTFPKMGDEWVPNSIAFAFNKHGLPSLFENLATVQFIHRYLGALFFLAIIFFYYKLLKLKIAKVHLKVAKLLLTITSVQITLGIFTLLYQVPLLLGVLHQLTAVSILLVLTYGVHDFMKLLRLPPRK